MDNIIVGICIGIVIIMIIAFVLLNRTKVIKNEGSLSLALPTPTPSQMDKSIEKNIKFDEHTQRDENKASVLPTSVQQDVMPYPQLTSTLDEFFPTGETLEQKDLMPTEETNMWTESNPKINAPLENKNFVQSGYHFGVDTVSSSKRNPNLGLRSDPIIVKHNVGPWSQSTIEPDTNRKEFEIGGN